MLTEVREWQNIEDAAKGMAGNWKKFHSFGWHDEPNDADGWTIIYTENRDSGLLEQSNAATIKKKLDRFDENEVQSEHHGHFAVGWVDGFAIRVFGKNGKITPAFKALWDIGQRMERYPVLDEEDYSRRELDALMENIESIGKRWVGKKVKTKDWIGDVYRWLDENASSELENRDDQGAYPDEDLVREALKQNGYLEGCEFDAKKYDSFEDYIECDLCKKAMLFPDEFWEKAGLVGIKAPRGRASHRPVDTNSDVFEEVRDLLIERAGKD